MPSSVAEPTTPEPEEEYTLFKVIAYDHGSQSFNLRISRKNIGKDVTKNISSKMSISREDAKHHHLVMVVTTADLKHCIRSIQPNESMVEVLDTIVRKMCEKYRIPDAAKLRSSVRWFYKDCRTPPLELGDSGTTVGEYDSDDEEILSESDCFYFSKVEKKGYMLKRSRKDPNLWKRWYCVLTDHLWCIDFNRDPYKVIRIRLHSMIRSKNGNSFSDQIQNIIVNPSKDDIAHHFRAFSFHDQKSWIEHLLAWTGYALENEALCMAEVIIDDEEAGKCRRFRKQLDRILDTNNVYEAMRVDHRKPPMSRHNSGTDELARLDELTLAILNDGNDSYGNGLVSNNNETASTKSTRTLERSTSSSSSKDEGDSIAPVTPISRAHSQSYLQPQGTATNQHQFVPLHPLDRTLTQPIIHRLHQYEFLLAYLLQFILEVQQYRELFRHDLFCPVQAQRNAAFTIFSQYLYRQGKAQGLFVAHDLLREMCEEQAEAASARLKLWMSHNYSQRPMDTYIASPGSLTGLSIQVPGGLDGAFYSNHHNVHLHQHSHSSQSYNSAAVAAAMRSPGPNRFRPASIVMQRFRSAKNQRANTITDGNSSSSSSRSNKNTGQGDAPTTPVRTPVVGEDEVTEENWKLPGALLESVLQRLFKTLLEEEEEDDNGSEDAVGELTSSGRGASRGDVRPFSSSRASTMLVMPDGKPPSLANSRKNPSGSGRHQTQSTSSPAPSTGFFFGLFGGSNNSSNNNSSNAAEGKSSPLRGAAASGAGSGGGGFFSRSLRFGSSAGLNAAESSAAKKAASASVLKALEEQEREELLRNITATVDVFDDVVQEIISLLDG